MKARPLLRTRAWTLVEMLVVIGLVGVLAAFLLPVVNNARKKSHQVQCLQNMRQIAQSLISYTNDHNGITPPAYDEEQGRNWSELLVKWDGSAPSLRNSHNSYGTLSYWKCPENRVQENAPLGSQGGEEMGGYAINGWSKTSLPHDNRFAGNRYANFQSPSKLYMLTEADYYRTEESSTDGTGSIPAGLYTSGVRRTRYVHFGKVNVVYADGHGESLEGPLLGRGRFLGGPSGRASSFSNGEAWYAN